MGTLAKVGGWIVAVVAILVAVRLEWQVREARGQRDAALHWKASLEDQNRDLTQAQKVAKAKTDEIEKKLADTTIALRKLKTDASQERASNIDDKKAANTNAFLSFLKGAHAEAENDNQSPEGFFKSFADMYKGEKGKELAKMSADMSVNMRYGQLFKELNLPTDVEDRVRGIISKSMADQVQQSFKMMSGEKSDPAKTAKDYEASQNEMRAELSQVLSPDELAKFDQYQQDLPRHMLEQQFDMQMSMTGSTMKPETRDLVKQTLVQEELAANPDYGKPGSASSTNPKGTMDAQIAAIDRARERLRQQLDDQQFAQADRFLTQQQAQARMAQEMMGSLWGAATNKKPAASNSK